MSLLNQNVNQVQAADTRAKIGALKSQSADWDNLPEGHVLLKMSAKLPEVIAEAGYSEMYGVQLVAPGEGQPAPFSTLLILQKFLRANENSVTKACSQLLGALKWRKEFRPLEVMKQVFPREKFEGLGYVTRIAGVPGSTNESDVATFNIYGAVKDVKKTFGDLDEFIRWRVALMELTLTSLSLPTTTIPIPDYAKGPDPHQAHQIHDYLSISFLRQPSEVKTASQKAISIFTANYPETLSKKFFVNVPLVMQWMFGAMKMFMAKETVEKMCWLSYGSELHGYLGEGVPGEYGGKGVSLGELGVTPDYGSGVKKVDGEVDGGAAAKEIAV